MKRFFVAILALCAAICSFAQSTGNSVHLKNGSVINGQIIEQSAQDGLKIKTMDGSIFVFKMEEVDRITQNTSTLYNYYQSEDAYLANNKHRGLDVSFNVGPTFLLGKASTTKLDADIEVGKKFNKNFYLGVGSGISVAEGDAFLPMILRSRFFFIAVR